MDLNIFCTKQYSNITQNFYLTIIISIIIPLFICWVNNNYIKKSALYNKRSEFYIELAQKYFQYKNTMEYIFETIKDTNKIHFDSAAENSIKFKKYINEWKEIDNLLIANEMTFLKQDKIFPLAIRTLMCVLTEYVEQNKLKFKGINTGASNIETTAMMNKDCIQEMLKDARSRFEQYMTKDTPDKKKYIEIKKNYKKQYNFLKSEISINNLPMEQLNEEYIKLFEKNHKDIIHKLEEIIDTRSLIQKYIYKIKKALARP